MVDISRLDEWDLRWRNRVEKLNSDPRFQMFEVGPRGTLVGGDVELSKSPDEELDEMEAKVTGVKPGIWIITVKEPREGDDFNELLLRWAAPGPLDFDDIPENLSPPDLNPLTVWNKVSGYSVDSGVGGVFDLDSLSNLIESHGDQDKEYVFETMSDFLNFDGRTSVQVGLVVGGGDGGYALKAREHEGEKVEILIQRNWSEEDDE